MPPAPTKPRMHALLDQLEHVEAIDAPAEAAAKQVRGAIPKGPIKDALSGTWLGHALHPLLTDVVVGSFTSSAVLDLVGGQGSAAASRKLVATGILASLPTAVTGASDWADTTPADPKVRRVGAVHASLNTVGLAFYAASYKARRDGRRGKGILLGLAGYSFLGVSAHLGGHLTYAQGVGVDQTTFHERSTEWVDVCAARDVSADGAIACGVAGDVRVAVVNDGGELRALEDRCNHRGGALSEGTVKDGCLVCPLHDSAFRLTDGSVERGPAAYAQPAYDARIRGDRVEVRARP